MCNTTLDNDRQVGRKANKTAAMALTTMIMYKLSFPRFTTTGRMLRASCRAVRDLMLPGQDREPVDSQALNRSLWCCGRHIRQTLTGSGWHSSQSCQQAASQALASWHRSSPWTLTHTTKRDHHEARAVTVRRDPQSFLARPTQRWTCSGSIDLPT